MSSNNIITPLFLAERVLRIAHKGDIPRDTELKIEDVLPMILDSANKILKADLFENWGAEGGKSVSSHFIHKWRQVPVQKLERGGQNFIDLPSGYVSLPHNMGIYRVAPDTGDMYKDEAMIPVSTDQMDIYRGILGKMQKNWVFYPENGRLYFHKRCGKTLCEEEIYYVQVSLVNTLGEIGDETPIQCPPEYHGAIVAEALDLISKTYGIRRDSLNDNNSDNE